MSGLCSENGLGPRLWRGQRVRSGLGRGWAYVTQTEADTVAHPRNRIPKS